MGLCCGRNTEQLNNEADSDSKGEEGKESNSDNDEEDEDSEEDEEDEEEEGEEDENDINNNEPKGVSQKNNKNIRTITNNIDKNINNEVKKGKDDKVNGIAKDNKVKSDETNRETKEIDKENEKTQKSISLKKNKNIQASKSSLFKINKKASLPLVVPQLATNLEQSPMKIRKKNLPNSLYITFTSFILSDCTLVHYYTPIPEIALRYYNPISKKLITRRVYTQTTSTIKSSIKEYKNINGLPSVMAPLNYPIKEKIIEINFNFLNLQDTKVVNKVINIKIYNNKRKKNPIILGEAYIPFCFLIDKDSYNFKIPIKENLIKTIGYVTMQVSKEILITETQSYELVDFTSKYQFLIYHLIDYELCGCFLKQGNIMDTKYEEAEWRTSFASRKMLSLIEEIYTYSNNKEIEKKDSYSIKKNYLHFKEATINTEEPIQYASLLYFISEIKLVEKDYEKLSKKIELITELLFNNLSNSFLSIPIKLYSYKNFVLIKVYFILVAKIVTYYINTDYTTVKEDLAENFNNDLIIQNLINNINIIIGLKGFTYDQKEEVIQIIIIILSIMIEMLQTNINNQPTLAQNKKRYSRVYNNAVRIFQQIDIIIELPKFQFILSHSEIISLLITLIKRVIFLLGDCDNNYYNIEDRPKIVIMSIVNKFIHEIKYNKFLYFIHHFFVEYYHHSKIYSDLLFIVITLCTQFDKNKKCYLIRKIFNLIPIEVILKNFKLYRNKNDGINGNINNCIYEMLMYVTEMNKNYILIKEKPNDIALNKQEVEIIEKEISITFTSSYNILAEKNLDFILFLCTIGGNLTRNSEISTSIWKQSFFFQNLLKYFFLLTKEEMKKIIDENKLQKEKITNTYGKIYTNCMIVLNNLFSKNGTEGKGTIKQFFDKENISVALIKTKIFDMINIGFVQLNYSNNEMKNVSESLILSLDDE